MFSLVVSLLGLKSILDDTPVRLYEGLGKFHRPVKTSDPVASRYLDQGFAFLYGFQYEIAGKSFKEAVRRDPKLVLGYWGIAAANANSINKTFVSEMENKVALEALQKARDIRSSGSRVENDLVDAAFLRFSLDPKAKRQDLNRAYADAMRKVWQTHKSDPDVGALFAESLINMRPWSQWTLDGKPQPGTEEALGVLRHVLKLDRDHPQALHLWIHTIEASQTPEQGLAEADRLMDLQPGLLHMQHMPAHIYDRTGHWKKAVEANVKSAAVYRRLFYAQGQGLNYSHGRHLLSYAAAMRGQSELALQQVDQIFDGVEPGAKNTSDYYSAMKAMFLVRFGRWAEILTLPKPDESLPFAVAMWHESRGVALAAQKNAEKVRKELEAFEAVRGKVEGRDNKQLIDIAGHVLLGEVLVSENKSDDAVKELQKAVELEDALPYGEPPDWIVPTRHTLGAILLDAKRYGEAAKVFTEDLRIHPHNGWALYGLFRAQTALNQTKDAAKTLTEFKSAWEDADFEISSSCMCLPDKP